MHLTHKHRDPQALAGALTRKELECTFGQMPAFTIMLRAFVCQETGTIFTTLVSK